MESVGVRQDQGPTPRRIPEALSPQRNLVLERVRQYGPLTVGTLSMETSLPPSAVDEHLDGLMDRRLVSRYWGAPVGRCRPAWLYHVHDAEQSYTTRDHIALTGLFIERIARTSSSPTRDARAAGREWGGALVAGQQPGTTTYARRRRLVELLDETGFSPEADGRASTIRLSRCPVRDAARAHPSLLCAFHVGLISAALRAFGAVEDAEHLRLEPFALAGGCSLLLGKGPARIGTAPTHDKTPRQESGLLSGPVREPISHDEQPQGDVRGIGH